MKSIKYEICSFIARQYINKNFYGLYEFCFLLEFLLLVLKLYFLGSNLNDLLEEYINYKSWAFKSFKILLRMIWCCAVVRLNGIFMLCTATKVHTKTFNLNIKFPVESKCKLSQSFYEEFQGIVFSFLFFWGFCRQEGRIELWIVGVKCINWYKRKV